MKHRYFFMLFFLLPFLGNAQVVINEVYGGGGNTGAPFKNDFVELYNGGSADVTIGGWLVEYYSSGGTLGSRFTIPAGASIKAKGYFLIQMAGGANGAALQPDATGTAAMAAGSGRVDFLNGTVLIDRVGYGSLTNAAFYEGSGPAPVLSNTTSAQRKVEGEDTGDNSRDFGAASPTPRNAAYGANEVSVAATGAAEPATTGKFTLTLNAVAATDVAVAYELGGTAAFGVDYTASVSGTALAANGTVTIAAGTAFLDIVITPVDDEASEGTEAISLALSNPTAGYTLKNNPATAAFTDDDAPISRIHTAQGAGATAQQGLFRFEAIVTSVLPAWSPAGFYIQEEDSDGDGDPATSEAIYVVSDAAVSVGDKIIVNGSVTESASTPSFGQAVVSNATITFVSANNTLPQPVQITLPLSGATALEAFEGMRVAFGQTLTVTDNYELGSRGTIALSEGGLVYQPTQVVDPNDADPGGTSFTGSGNVAAVNEYAAASKLRTILLDDGRSTAPTALPYVNEAATLPLGSTATGITGVLGYGFNNYRVQPDAATNILFSYLPRPQFPGFGEEANVKVASFNVLNYFNGDGAGGGFPTARGANSPAEFSRQRAKILDALIQINADVLGLIELENDGTGSNAAIRDIVAGLNEHFGAGTYSFIEDGAAVQQYNTDAIRSAILYKPAVVAPVGAAMLSGNTVFNRPPVAQNFKTTATNKAFVFIVNHFKSKGCGGATGADVDGGDGQSCYNATRVEQATALINFINTEVIPAAGHDRVLSVGDYNAYFEEDPLDALRAASFKVLGSSSGRSYLFSGLVGSLDHAVASATLSADVTAVAKWNINSPEPVYLDYNDGIRDGGEGTADVNPWANFYTVSPFRSSDHDPVLIGLSLQEDDSDGDGTVDSKDNCPQTANAGQLDTDGDGTGDACDADDDGDGVADADDCKPLDKTIYPGAAELCDGIDNNCDGAIDEGVGTIWYADADGDGWGDAAQSQKACVQPAGYVSNNTDNCPAAYNPDQADFDKDGTGNACDADDDGDGVADLQDCKPFNAAVYPGRTEICNGIDDNCDGQIDEGCAGTPVLSIANVTVYEAEGVARLTVRLSKVSTQTIKLAYGTADGTAVSKKGKSGGTDYTATSGTLSIKPGIISGTITVPITNDGVAEGDETFEVVLSKPSNAVIGAGRARVTIKDGIPPALAKIQPRSSTAPEAPTQFSVQVLSNPASGYFTLQLKSNNNNPVAYKVVDAAGKVLEARGNIAGNGTLRIGERYTPGMYYVQFMQGQKLLTIKLVKGRP